MKKKKIVAIIITVVVLVGIAGAAVNLLNKNNGVKKVTKKEEVEKNITIIINNPETEVKEYKVVTKSKYVKDAFDQAEGLEIKYDERFEEVEVIAINGRERTFKREYWEILINDDYPKKSVESQEIADGDIIKATLMQWDTPIE